MNKKINMFILSDIHLGHHINKTERLVKLLYAFLDKYKNYIKKSDLFIISGDTYDRLLSSNSRDLHLSLNFLTSLLNMCSKYGIKLRILEGTPSHDMRQIELLNSVLKDLKLDVDFKYIKELSIEHIEDLDIDILYLPDEWKAAPDEVWKDITKTLKKHNKEKVDIVVMHGGFRYQIPMLADHMHDEELFNNLTYGGPIISGHIHTRSKYKNIIIPGSFDRLTFNDEDEDKGGLFITYDKGNKSFNFIYLDNPNPMVFKTIDLKETNLKTLDNILRKLNEKDSHVRFLVDSNDKLNEVIMEFQIKYPNIKFYIKSNKDKNQTDKKIDLSTINLDKVKITQDDIREYIINKERDNERLNIILEELNNIYNTL